MQRYEISLSVFVTLNTDDQGAAVAAVKAALDAADLDYEVVDAKPLRPEEDEESDYDPAREHGTYHVCNGSVVG